MSVVIVVTNFSDSSRNALDYACNFLHNPQTEILLLNIFSFSGSLTGDALAIAAMSETIANDERKLQEEVRRIKAGYPHISIRSEMTTGVFMDELRTTAIEEKSALIIMGAGGNYNELLSWDANIINAFVDLDIPVLIIPAQVQFKSIQKIAFACNYYRENLLKPVSMIRKLIEFTKAQLFIIHVVSPAEIINEVAEQNKSLLQQNLQDLSPIYYEPAVENIINAIDTFTAEKNIDMLIVIPSRHGIWLHVFQESHTKGLVNLNHIPVVSLHQEGGFI